MFSQLHFLLKLMFKKFCYLEPEPGAKAGAGSWSRSRLNRLHNTAGRVIFLKDVESRYVVP